MTRLFDLIDAYTSSAKESPGLYAFREGKWLKWDKKAILNGVAILRKWFSSRGIIQGDRIMTIPELGSPEWMMIDWACWMEGIVLVPVHKTVDSAILKKIILQTSPAVCIASDLGQYHKARSMAPNLETYHLEYHAEYSLPVLSQLLHPQQQSAPMEGPPSISPDALACIMYTSGTSGAPKGVQLSHANIVSNIEAVRRLLPLRPGHRTLSFLPYSHIFERTSCLTYVSLGVDLYFSSGKDHLLRDFQQVRPHFFTAVPRMLEKTYDYVIGMQLSANPLKRWLAKWAVRVGKQYGTDRGRGVFFGMKLWASRQLYYRFWHRRMGGSVRWVAVGAAALPSAIAQIFGAAGVQVREGYGMTETSPVISFNRFDKRGNKPGSVGKAVEGVQIKLLKKKQEDQHGEIVVRGPNVMSGYYKDPEGTLDAFTKDGWLKTGDIGKIDEAGFLTITDRAKDIFKTSSGKYIAPARMEQLFCNSPYIHQCLYIGANRPFPTAVVVPNFHLLKRWAKRNKIHWTSPQYMVHNIKIVDKIQSQIDQINQDLPNYKRVRSFVLCHEEWTAASGDISASLKLVRKQLLEKYQKQINKLYPAYNKS